MSKMIYRDYWTGSQSFIRIPNLYLPFKYVVFINRTNRKQKNTS